MGVASDKTRMNFTISKELKKKLEIQAKKENRTTSNMINVALEKYLSEQK